MPPRLAALLRDPDFRRGAREMASLSLGLGAWGLVTGVAMADSGIGIVPALLMSLFVYAGSSQLAALPLIAAGAPLWVIWATAFCVNLRFVVFSVQWRPYLMHLPRGERLLVGFFCTDLNYVACMRRFPEPRPQPGFIPYLIGGIVVNWVSWQVPSIVGVLAAKAIPPHWGIGFAGTLALLGLSYSLLADRSTGVAAAIAGLASVAAYALPLKLNIVVAIAAAVAAGLLLDRIRPPRVRSAGEPR